MDYAKNKIRSKKAQQLVEFALVAPIFLTIVVLIIELGFAINTRETIAEAVKSSVMQSNELSNQTGSDSVKKESIRSAIEENIKTYASDHGIPNSSSVRVEIIDISGSDKAVVMAYYTYKPYFSLPFTDGFLKSQFDFSSYQIISNRTFLANTGISTLSSNDLASFWKNTSLDGRKGILKNEDIDGISIDDIKKHLAILISFDSAYGMTRLFNWWGEDLLPPNLYLNMSTGTLFVKSQYYSTSFFDTKIPISWVLTSLGFTQAMYSSPNAIPPITNPTAKLDLSSDYASLNKGIYWCDQSSSISGNCDSSDFSDDSINNQLKNTVSFLFGTTSKPYGTYEPVIDNNGTFTENKISTYATYNSSYDYLLKLFMPNSGLSFTAGNIYKYKFSIDASGLYDAFGSDNTDIVDVYMDNDADGIPNAWDKHPDIADINANGILDGNETSQITAGSYITDLPEKKSNATMVVGYTYDPSGGASTCFSGTTYPRKGYTITNIATTTTNAGSLPFDLDSGAVNLTREKNAYIPAKANTGSSTVIITFDLTQRNAGCSITGTSTLQSIYFKTASNSIRKVSTWDSNAATALGQKNNFINGYTSGSTIELNKSFEVDELMTGAFSNANRVTR